MWDNVGHASEAELVWAGWVFGGTGMPGVWGYSEGRVSRIKT